MEKRILNINLAKVELPTIKLSNNKQYVEYKIEGKHFPSKVVEYLNYSPIHNAIISLKKELTTGDGFIFDEGNIKLKSFFDKINQEESANDLLEKVSFDLAIHGEFYLYVIWSKDKTSISEVHHLDRTKVLCSEPEKFGKIHFYFVSDDWNKNNPKYEIYPAFNSGDKNEGIQILRYASYQPGGNVYALPDYFPVIPYVLISKELSQFHLSNISNSFLPSAIIQFPEPASPEEMTRIESQLKDKFQGTDNAGQVMVAFSNEDKVVNVIPISNIQNEKLFESLNNIVNQQLTSGHRLPNPSLAGLPLDGGSLDGGSNTLNTAFNLFQNQKIKPMQNAILKTFKKILDINKIDSSTLQISNLKPIETVFSESVLSNILTKDEMREQIGYEPLTITENKSIITE